MTSLSSDPLPQNQLPLIPLPQHLQRDSDKSRTFELAFHVSGDALTSWQISREELAKTISAYLGPGATLCPESDAHNPHSTPAINLTTADVDAASLEGDLAGAYEIRIQADMAEISAATMVGIRHGLATLAQLHQSFSTPTPTSSDSPTTATLPLVHIIDAPRYPWRGFSLDVVRRFYPVPEIFRLIDLLASLKLNVLHLHLTDDQGWRLEVPGRPELTDIGGAYAAYDRSGGFYTTDQAREIGEYAALRGIGIVPEVDLPGHTNAALNALPELNPDGIAPTPYHGIEVGFSYLHTQIPETFTFIDDVIAAACAISTSGYVHVGGDEVLQLDHEQFAHLIEHACKVVVDHGLTPVVWQEGVRAQLPAGTHVQYWNPNEGTAEVAEKIADHGFIISSPADRAYLDMKPDPDFPLGLTWSGIVPLEQSYSWDPFTVFAQPIAQQVAGVEAAVWSETITSYDDFLALVLPRLYAVAEVAWTPTIQRNFADFSQRLAQIQGE